MDEPMSWLYLAKIWSIWVSEKGKIYPLEIVILAGMESVC